MKFNLTPVNVFTTPTPAPPTATFTPTPTSTPFVPPTSTFTPLPPATPTVLAAAADQFVHGAAAASNGRGAVCHLDVVYQQRDLADRAWR